MRFVQHMSEQGQRYEVMETTPPQPVGFRFRDEKEWAVYANDQSRAWLILPKSEYHEVPAPEVWVDVTAACRYNDTGEERAGITHDGLFNRVCVIDIGYRLRKVERGQFGYAFLVEKRTP